MHYVARVSHRIKQYERDAEYDLHYKKSFSAIAGSPSEAIEQVQKIVFDKHSAGGLEGLYEMTIVIDKIESRGYDLEARN